jgi:hypothetical protein
VEPQRSVVSSKIAEQFCAVDSQTSQSSSSVLPKPVGEEQTDSCRFVELQPEASLDEHTSDGFKYKLFPGTFSTARRRVAVPANRQPLLLHLEHNDCMLGAMGAEDYSLLCRANRLPHPYLDSSAVVVLPSSIGAVFHLDWIAKRISKTQHDIGNLCAVRRDYKFRVCLFNWLSEPEMCTQTAARRASDWCIERGRKRSHSRSRRRGSSRSRSRERSERRDRRGSDAHDHRRGRGRERHSVLTRA